jgi:high-affinity nickel-transport protein
MSLHDTGSIRPKYATRFLSSPGRRLLGLYGTIALLHGLGWGLLLAYSARYPTLVGLGLAAYLFGLRHAFDADHIAAVDDTVRYLVQKGQRPLGVGFFFSLGHSTVVFVLAVLVAATAGAITRDMPVLQHAGGLIGAVISGVFLWLIGLLNLRLLLDMRRAWQAARRGRHSHEHIEELLARRGLLNRLLGRRVKGMITHSWQMYPIGLLFGLGFDTASEVALLAMTAGAASGNLPVGALLALPLLFAAGMMAMDTTDGVLMVRAYGWAFVNPVRKIFYNLFTTGVSITVALVIGTVELAQVLIHLLALRGPLFDRIAAVDFATLGYAVVALLLLAWALSVAIWRFGRFDQSSGYTLHEHEHRHADGRKHTHRTQ